jgi:putative peptidoglycan lipid II flippase
LEEKTEKQAVIDQAHWAGLKPGMRVLDVGCGPGLTTSVLAWAAQGVDWIALQAHWGQRALAVAGVLGGVALLYFAVLAACGLRPRQFIRRG